MSPSGRRPPRRDPARPGAATGAVPPGAPELGVPLALPGRRLRLARLARQLSQEQLADAAGVTRQAVAGIEGGRFDPSLKVALRLAAALATPVEALFGGGDGVSTVRARLVGPVGTGATGDAARAGSESPSASPSASAPGSASGRVALAAVAGRAHAFPLQADAGAVWGFRPATGLLQEPAEPHGAGRGVAGADDVSITLLGGSGRVLVVAGCDPALPLLARPLARLDPPVELLWWPCSSTRALELLAAGAVHAAGAHLRDERGGYNAGRARSALGTRGGAVVGFAAWLEGMAVTPEAGHAIRGLDDVVRAGLRVVNREPGAEARAVLDRERQRCGLDPRELPGWETVMGGHLQVAAAVAAGLAGAGVTCEPAALAYGLGFVPLAAERFDLVVAREQMAVPEVGALLAVLGGDELRGQLASLPGYDPSDCGTVVDSF